MPPTPRRIHRGGPGPDRYAGPLPGNQWTIADRGATVLGIDFTNDLVLQIRDLSYPDTQLIRLGGQNFGHCRCNRLSYDDHGFGALRRWANTTTPAGPDGPTRRRSRIEGRQLVPTPIRTDDVFARARAGTEVASSQGTRRWC